MNTIVTITDPEKFRNNIRENLAKYFSKYSRAENLEKGIYNWSLKEAKNRKIIRQWNNPYFYQIYTDRLRSIFINLQNNPTLIQLIENKKIKPHELAFMSHQEMCPERWKELIQAKIIRDQNKYEQNSEATTDIFTCRKCKSNKCSYYQLQTRSADEPMTTFVQCLNCSNRWRC